MRLDTQQGAQPTRAVRAGIRLQNRAERNDCDGQALSADQYSGRGHVSVRAVMGQFGAASHRDAIKLMCTATHRTILRKFRRRKFRRVCAAAGFT